MQNSAAGPQGQPVTGGEGIPGPSPAQASTGAMPERTSPAAPAVAGSAPTAATPGSAGGKKPVSLTYQRPKLYPEQLAAIFAPERWSLVEATTKAGKTSACIAWLVEKAILGPAGRNYWWIAPVAQQAAIAFSRLGKALAEDLRVTNQSKQTVTLINGAVIWFKTGEDPDNLFGEDVYAAVIDEASRVREASWHAVRTTLSATKGPARIIGNVKGRRNWFYHLCRKAENGEHDMTFHKLTWRHAVKAGILDEREVDDAKRLLPPAVFRELYEAEPSDDQGNPFGIASIARCVAPLTGNPVVCAGGDFGKRTDWCAFIGLDRDGRTSTFDRWQRMPWPETTERFARCIGHAHALCDSTGVGDPIVDMLQRKCPSVEGYWFTPKSKQALMENLATMIQAGEISFPDGPIRVELEAFEFATRIVGGRVTGVEYAAPPGMHDDCVCALALAAWHRKFGGHVGAFHYERNEPAARAADAWGLGHDERDQVMFG